MKCTRIRGKKGKPHLDLDDPPRRRGNKVRGHGTWENDRPPVAGVVGEDVRLFAGGTVDRLLGGADQDVALVRDMTDDGTVFAAAAGLVRSAALARLRPDPTTPVGLLALGSRKRAFHPGQGTELIGFMARMLECCVHGWRERPA